MKVHVSFDLKLNEGKNQEETVISEEIEDLLMQDGGMIYVDDSVYEVTNVAMRYE